MLINENLRSYRFRYDGADRLIEERRPDGTRLGYEYDANGEVVALIHHPGLGDDVFGEIESEGAAARGSADSGPRRTEFRRDAADRLIEKRCGQQGVRFRYDKADQLLEAVRRGEDGQPLHTTRFDYDVLGRIVGETAIDHPTGRTHTLAHEHDALGNRTRTRLPELPGSAQRHLHYLHYGSGHLHHVRLSLDEGEGLQQQSRWHVVADFERDDLHREILRTQGALSTRYQLDALGRRLGSHAHRGTGLGVLPDNLPGLSTHLPGIGIARLAKTYRYDASGELREAHHPLKGAARYDYDPTGRLEAVLRGATAGGSTQSGTPQSEHYAYDPAGNLLEAAQLERRGYVRDNRIRVFEDKRYAYDDFGRLIEKRSGKHTVQRFQWDDEDRLIAVTTTRRPGTAHETTQSTRFEYDALGRRIAKTDAFGRTEFIWEGMRLIEERRGSNAIAYVYEPGSYVPLARIDASGVPIEDAANAAGGSAKTAAASGMADGSGGNASPGTAGVPGDDDSSGAKLFYFHTDPSGLPEELSDAQGRLRWRAAYRAWGNTVQEHWEATDLDGRPIALDATEESQPIEQNLRYQGQYLDRDTGLHYNTFRYYDPDIGRFISPDPTGLDGGENLYQYSPNPISWIDPWGWAKTPLNKGGFTVYGLYRPGESEPYYVGHTKQTQTARESQHRGTGRLLGEAELRPLAGDGGTLTNTQAKGYEQAYSEKYGTKKGFPGNVIEPINKNRMDARGKSHYKNYRAAAKDIGIKPKRGKC